jgi:hypothetical protein
MREGNSRWYICFLPYILRIHSTRPIRLNTKSPIRTPIYLYQGCVRLSRYNRLDTFRLRTYPVGGWVPISYYPPGPSGVLSGYLVITRDTLVIFKIFFKFLHALYVLHVFLLIYRDYTSLYTNLTL